MWAMAVIACGAPSWAFLRRRKAPNALLDLWSELAAKRNAAAARLALGLVRLLRVFPPVISLPGHNPNQDVKCLTVGHRVISRPTSLMTFSAVYPSIPSILDSPYRSCDRDGFEGPSGVHCVAAFSSSGPLPQIRHHCGPQRRSNGPRCAGHIQLFSPGRCRTTGPARTSAPFASGPAKPWFWGPEGPGQKTIGVKLL